MRRKKYSKYTGVLFSDETYQRLKGLTDTKELSLSEFIRSIIEDQLKLYEMEERDE